MSLQTVTVGCTIEEETIVDDEVSDEASEIHLSGLQVIVFAVIEVDSTESGAAGLGRFNGHRNSSDRELFSW